MSLGTHHLALLSCIALLGCGEERHTGGGGFETGDLQARVCAPTGDGAAHALVWLVRSQSDSAPADVIDSAWTDSAGLASFALPDGTDRSKLGLDARRGDSLGIATGGFAHSDSAKVDLAKSGTVETGLDSTRILPSLFVAGSHFKSSQAPGMTKSVLQLPQGAWNVTIKKPKTLGSSQPVTVGDQPVRIGGPVWSTKSLLWSDSVMIPGGIMDSILYRDTTLAAPYQWQTRDGFVDNRTYSAALVSGTNGSTSMRTSMGKSPGDVQVASGIVSPPLPPLGVITLSYKFLHDPYLDSGLVRTITLLDSAKNGVQIDLAKDGKQLLVISTFGGAVVALDSTRTIPVDPIQATEWILVWTGKYIELRQGESMIARYYSGWNPSQAHPTLSLDVASTRTGLNTEIQIGSLKLYQPK